MFIVPPTEDIGSGEDPNPLWTCIAETTSVRPAQLLQKTLPFSISLTGIPFIKTAIFSCWNPLNVILESPNAPPPPVANTPGVEFNNSGNSRLPILSSISDVVNVETATGVWRSLAKKTDPKTVTPDKTLSPGCNLIIPTFADPSTAISWDSYPTYEITSVASESTVIENEPLKSLETPSEVPLTTIVAPGRPVPISESTTVPETVVWANPIPETRMAAKNNINFLIFE